MLKKITFENLPGFVSPVTVEFGKLTLITGSSTSGKSFLLRLMASLLNNHGNIPDYYYKLFNKERILFKATIDDTEYALECKHTTMKTTGKNYIDIISTINKNCFINVGLYEEGFTDFYEGYPFVMLQHPYATKDVNYIADKGRNLYKHLDKTQLVIETNHPRLLDGIRLSIIDNNINPEDFIINHISTDTLNKRDVEQVVANEYGKLKYWPRDLFNELDIFSSLCFDALDKRKKKNNAKQS